MLLAVGTQHGARRSPALPPRALVCVNSLPNYSWMLEQVRHKKKAASQPPARFMGAVRYQRPCRQSRRAPRTPFQQPLSSTGSPRQPLQTSIWKESAICSQHRLPLALPAVKNRADACSVPLHHAELLAAHDCPTAPGDERCEPVVQRCVLSISCKERTGCSQSRARGGCGGGTNPWQDLEATRSLRDSVPAWKSRTGSG